LSKPAASAADVRREKEMEERMEGGIRVMRKEGKKVEVEW